MSATTQIDPTSARIYSIIDAIMTGTSVIVIFPLRRSSVGIQRILSVLISFGKFDEVDAEGDGVIELVEFVVFCVVGVLLF